MALKGENSIKSSTVCTRKFFNCFKPCFLFLRNIFFIIIAYFVFHHEKSYWVTYLRNGKGAGSLMRNFPYLTLGYFVAGIS